MLNQCLPKQNLSHSISALKEKKGKKGGGVWRKLEKKEKKALFRLSLIIITKENEL